MSNVLVTGSSRGLGLELVKQIAAHPDLKGGVVVASARKCSPQLQEVISSSGGAVAFVALDIVDEGSIAKSAEEVKSALGGGSLDFLINCAGVHSETHGKVTLICCICPVPGIQDQQSRLECVDSAICSLWLKSDMGGQDADLTVPQGAEAVLRTVIAANGQNNGSFKNIYVPGWDKYDGQNMPVQFADACVVDEHLGRDLIKGLLSFFAYHLRTPRSSPGPAVRETTLPRQRGVHSSTPTASSITTDEESNYHAIHAKGVIQIDLQNHQAISIEQQALLKSALQLTSSIAGSQAVSAIEEESSEPDSSSPVPETPPRELLFMLLPGAPESVKIQWPHPLSDNAYARMAATLLRDRSELEATKFHQYCVCIYVRAILHLYQVSRSLDDAFLRSELSKSRLTYVVAAMRSTEQFNILKPPDLLTIQSLLSSALLMQHMGRPYQCWLFVSYAARQITALNYHKIRRLPATSEKEQDIQDVVYWCYYLDQTLSSLLCRPPSLPDLAVSPTDLVVSAPSSPYDSMMRIVLDLAQVQGQLRTISCGSRNERNELALEICLSLEARMQAMLPRLQAVYSIFPLQNRDSQPKAVQYDWVAADFTYYAIFVELHRTRLKSAFSATVHRECLGFARKALRAFHFLQQHPSELPGFDDPYPSFLTCAFFVVFCHIIGTIDRDDFDLMGQIIQHLAPFKRDRHLGKLVNLLQSLQRLCEPLFQTPSDGGGGAAAAPGYGDAPAVAADVGPIDADNRALIDTPLPPVFPRDGDDMWPMPATGTDPSADWLMWELFNSQVSAGWLSQDNDPFDVGFMG
ncbi:hypothetical protein BO82DRAFT_271971 [Aspergillus uvarum CBS 121591]|uniref:Xylanolytic transcriptional activator regulatory domain-containing protein n=1 Tax=Aspergillus uvarum CBS 121591 TaxID=1448315 RepID=A0A319CNG8_9EURO|nr:hypothetical protein BO82DRAFT_271971 [Aspergillus uvarum CBS 121591]PYH86714.1 hypothetical protein BO82DRAFT_271971 [Aspergillus uvarum CBS 121591]